MALAWPLNTGFTVCTYTSNYYTIVDDFAPAPITVMFPPTTTSAEQTITITLQQDFLFEPAVEGFYLVVGDIQSLNVDIASANNSVALVNIEDIDSEL